MTKIEMIERKLEQGRKYWIMNSDFLEKVSAERSAREAMMSKIVAWVSAGAAVVAAIAAIITFF